MAARPLPGASFHIADLSFHDVDPEAVDSYGPSEKEPRTSQGTAHLRRGRPVMLILLLLCCLAFVASAFTGNPSDDQYFEFVACVPERHAPLADRISAAFLPKPDAERVFVIQSRALDILKQKHNSTSRVGCHAANVRDYLRQTYPVVESSLHWTNVSQSAVVLHWQGAGRKLRPILITNEPEVELEVLHFRSGEHKNREELADVESAVGMLTAVEALVQNGYQPLRTLVFSLMLGEAADIHKVSDYLHATYDEHGLEMGFEPPPAPDYRIRILYKMHEFVDRLYWGVNALFPIPATPPCFGTRGDTPYFLRYDIDPDKAALPAKAVNVWARMIIAVGQ